MIFPVYIVYNAIEYIAYLKQNCIRKYILNYIEFVLINERLVSWCFVRKDSYYYSYNIINNLMSCVFYKTQFSFWKIINLIFVMFFFLSKKEVVPAILSGKKYSYA
jgi:hypothetical protein